MVDPFDMLMFMTAMRHIGENDSDEDFDAFDRHHRSIHHDYDSDDEYGHANYSTMGSHRDGPNGIDVRDFQQADPLFQLQRQLRAEREINTGGLRGFMDRTKRLSQQNRGPPVYSAQLKPNFLAVQEFVAAYRHVNEQAKEMGEGVSFHIKNTVTSRIQNAMAPSRGIEGTKSIALDEIARKVNHIHEGYTLFVKVAHKPYRLVGSAMLVQDDNGDMIQFVAYNYVTDDEGPEEIFPEGTHLAIMHPHMKNSQDDRRLSLVLRCDNPQCIVLYPDEESWLTAMRSIGHQKRASSTRRKKSEATHTRSSPSDLRQKGNRAFGNRKFHKAERLYSRAIDDPSISTEDKIACLSNRAETYVRREQWEDVEEDCRKVLDHLDPGHVKCRFRLATAVLHLGRVGEANDLLTKLLMEQPKEPSFKSLKTTVLRMQKQKKGNFDLQAMHRDVEKKVHRLHASFVSPKVKVGAEIPKEGIGSYRGCLATADIKEGDLLFASKAFAFVDASHDEFSPIQIHSDLRSGQCTENSRAELSNKIVTMLHRRPKLGPRLFKLAGASKYPEHVDLETIHLHKVREILYNNVFSTNPVDEGVQADLYRMGVAPEEREEKMRARVAMQRMSRGSGLWINESLINHSCRPNCCWNQIADHMFIRALRPIPKGEEICISYCNAFTTAETADRFKDWTGEGEGFECACDRCAMFRQRAELKQIEEEVHEAYEVAASLVEIRGLKMAHAAQLALSEARRHEILEVFRAIPKHCAADVLEKVYTMEGAVLNARGQRFEALQCFENAADAMYAGWGAMYPYAKQLWRVVGSSMRCGKPDKAIRALSRIRRMDCFSGQLATATRRDAKKLARSGGGLGEHIFMRLTLVYSSCWWKDEADYAVRRELAQMASAVWRRDLKHPTRVGYRDGDRSIRYSHGNGNGEYEFEYGGEGEERDVKGRGVRQDKRAGSRRKNGCC